MLVLTKIMQPALLLALLCVLAAALPADQGANLTRDWGLKSKLMLMQRPNSYESQSIQQGKRSLLSNRPPRWRNGKRQDNLALALSASASASASASLS
ncbi:uncharacterized protein BO95DRAFT_464046 [Aspergillus brunneoviolaceus CBS 621.78]|uniref:Uncharacterized protein n=1 Tax=Aspergillus brunneoviolaceus CBS 621.78 TaxID=1450534 RepID=A0ACD1G8A8_9EURO|nr:hypothetical protein BO95DRAFT_464046 [Aspergillus brunneoviolaceus CBS 621.78]RAH45521.1 hypothetical protein BO95DRAFT_464046 [Aspergillus brunneoviolaceus CBS 621.78]